MWYLCRLYDAATGCGINPKSCALTAYPAEVCEGRICVDLDRKFRATSLRVKAIEVRR